MNKMSDLLAFIYLLPELGDARAVMEVRDENSRQQKGRFRRDWSGI